MELWNRRRTRKKKRPRISCKFRTLESTPMKPETEKLTEADRALAHALVAQTMQTIDYGLTLRWIERAGLYRRCVMKTCSIHRVRLAMLKSTGIAVSEGAMGVALAEKGFSSREIGDEWITNVALRSLPKPGAEIDMSDPPRPGETVTCVRAREETYA